MGSACTARPEPKEMISMFGKRLKGDAGGGEPASELPTVPASPYPMAPTPKTKAVSAGKGRPSTKAAGKSMSKAAAKAVPKPPHATKSTAKKSPPLPEFRGVGKKPPIRYGKSTVYFSPANDMWRVKPEDGSRVTHQVRWGRIRKDQVMKWEKVKEWLSNYN